MKFRFFAALLLAVAIGALYLVFGTPESASQPAHRTDNDFRLNVQ